jgi:glycyl-tRNA synthetase beta subunit
VQPSSTTACAALRERGFAQNEVEAVAQQPDVLDDVRAPGSRAGLRRLPEAEALAAANKRITNILKKIEGVAIDAHGAVQEGLLQEAAEQGLYAAMRPPVRRSRPPCQGRLRRRAEGAGAAAPNVDAFFNDVMVMAEDERCATTAWPCWRRCTACSTGGRHFQAGGVSSTARPRPIRRAWACPCAAVSRKQA